MLALLFHIFLVGQESPVQTPKADAPSDSLLVEQQPAPEGQAFEYTYNPIGKRDPFDSYLRNKSEKLVLSENPLLNWDISKFSLSGVVWGMANPRAIVVDGDGKGHIIRVGTRMGRNRGKVMRILKDRVVVAEEFRDPLGKLVINEVSMTLKEDVKAK